MKMYKMFCFFLFPVFVFAQPNHLIKEPTPPQAAERVDVNPTIQDVEIKQRLENILQATGWFIHPSVNVQEGVVFLYGQTQSDEFKVWAGNLARNTQDVAAVVNKISLIEPSFWDLQLDFQTVQKKWKQFLFAIPSIFIGILILFVAWGIAKFCRKLFTGVLDRNFGDTLLREIVSKIIESLIFLFGVYIIFEMADLTGAALTILSGTGVLGIILGIAFRDITENFLASILLSIQNPFRNGDLIEIGEVKGFVQRLTMRATLLMSVDGIQIQVPNATVYKSNIRNLTSNPIRREEVVIGIGFDEAISKAQEIALRSLAEHEAVLKDPEPWVLVDNLGKSTINLRVYFWFNVAQYSPLKVKSSVLRLVKRAFQEARISVPDEGREVIFPQGIAVQIIEAAVASKQPSKKESSSYITGAESGLASDAENIQILAQQSQRPEEGKDILGPPKSQKPEEGKDTLGPSKNNPN